METGTTKKQAIEGMDMKTDVVETALAGQTEEMMERVRLAIRAENSVLYQTSKTYPGYLERISKTGEVTIGQFSQGEFKQAKF